MGLFDRVRSFFSDVPAQQKEAKKFNKAAGQREGAALGELTPEAMQALIQMFMSKYMSILSPQMQFAQQKLAAGAGRAGLSHAGLTQQLQAGIPGQFSLEALRQALGSALPIAQQRAGIVSNRPIAVSPATSRAKHDLLNTYLSYYSGGQIKGTGGSQTSPTPYG